MKNSVSGIITAFLAGAAAGALLGVLFAPEKGSVTRARLKAVGEELGEEFGDTLDAIKREFGAEEPVKEKKAAKGRRGRKPGPKAKKAGA